MAWRPACVRAMDADTQDRSKREEPFRPRVFRHPAKQGFLQLQEWHFEVCGDKTQGLLLAFFEGWHRTKLGRAKAPADHPQRIWQWHSKADMESGILGLASKNTIGKALEGLAKKGFIETQVRADPRSRGQNVTHVLLLVDVVQAKIDELYPPTEDANGRQVNSDPPPVNSDPPPVKSDPPPVGTTQPPVKTGRSSTSPTLPFSPSPPPSAAAEPVGPPTGAPAAAAPAPASAAAAALLGQDPEAFEAERLLVALGVKPADAADIIDGRGLAAHIALLTPLFKNRKRRRNDNPGGWWRDALRVPDAWGPDPAGVRIDEHLARRMFSEEERKGKDIVEIMDDDEIAETHSILIEHYRQEHKEEAVRLLLAVRRARDEPVFWKAVWRQRKLLGYE